jgi:hypothetical protein
MAVQTGETGPAANITSQHVPKQSRLLTCAPGEAWARHKRVHVCSASSTTIVPASFTQDAVGAYNASTIGGGNQFEIANSEALLPTPGGIVVAEEHLAYGGLGATVAMALAARRPTRMAFVDLGDTYATSGTPEELLERYGLTPDAVLDAARRVLKD